LRASKKKKYNGKEDEIEWFLKQIKIIVEFLLFFSIVGWNGNLLSKRYYTYIMYPASASTKIINI
jgi:hypothetical protein